MVIDDLQTDKKVGEYWTKRYENKNSQRENWWDSDFVKRRINQLITDVDSPIISEGLNQLLVKRLGGRRLKTGVSVGCGVASKELRLLELGVVDKFMLFDLSEEALKSSAEMAANLGFSDKIELHNEDAFSYDYSCIEIEMVHWNNSLHHMFDVPAAVKWSHDILSPQGVFYMDDYVGPNRFQHPDIMLHIADELKKTLLSGKISFDAVTRRIDPDMLASVDPSEAVDSERILESVRTYFPQAHITLTGGIVYFLALEGLYCLFDEDNEDHLFILNRFMEIDKLYTKHPNIPSLYATALAFK